MDTRKTKWSKSQICSEVCRCLTTVFSTAIYVATNRVPISTECPKSTYNFSFGVLFFIVSTGRSREQGNSIKTEQRPKGKSSKFIKAFANQSPSSAEYVQKVAQPCVWDWTSIPLFACYSTSPIPVFPALAAIH